MYLPYCCPENFDAYQTYLGELSSFCKINAALEIFILGDFNAEKGNQFWQILMDFCEDNNFIVSHDSLLPDTSFTYISNSHNSTSWIDHCVTSAMAHHLIINIEVLLEYICSDHHPLLVNINYSPTANHHSNICDQNSSDYKPINWQNLTPKKRQIITNLLNHIYLIYCYRWRLSIAKMLGVMIQLIWRVYQHPIKALLTAYKLLYTCKYFTLGTTRIHLTGLQS